MSDYDFGMLMDEKLSKSERFDMRIELMGDLGKVLKTDQKQFVTTFLPTPGELPIWAGEEEKTPRSGNRLSDTLNLCAR